MENRQLFIPKNASGMSCVICGRKGRNLLSVKIDGRKGNLPICQKWQKGLIYR